MYLVPIWRVHFLLGLLSHSWQPGSWQPEFLRKCSLYVRSPVCGKSTWQTGADQTIAKEHMYVNCHDIAEGMMLPPAMSPRHACSDDQAPA